MPGTTTPEQEPLEQVTEQAQPSRSSTAMWVVEPSGPRDGAAAQEARNELRVVEPGEELGRALALRPLHDLDDPLEPRRPGFGVEQPSARAIRIPPADGGGLVSTSRPR